MEAMNRFLSKLQMKDVREDTGNTVFIPYRERAVDSTRTVQSAVYEGTQAVHGIFRERTQAVQDEANKRAWMWKAKRNKQILPLSRGVISGGVVAAALYSRFAMCDDCIIWSWVLAAIAICLLLDPLEMVFRVMSLATRALISFDLALWVTVIWFDDYMENDFGSFVLCITILLGFIACIGNRFWLKKENWLYTDSVAKAMVIDPDNKCSDYWKDKGRREARSLIHQLGHDLSEYDLEGLAFPLFSLGYWCENESKRKLQNEITELNEIIEENAAVVQEANEILQSYGDIEETESYYEVQYQKQKEEIERLKACIASLNIELEARETAPAEPEEPEIETKQDITDKIMYLYNEKGYGYDRIAKEIGKSKSYVANIVRTNKDAAEEETEPAAVGKVVSFR